MIRQCIPDRLRSKCTMKMMLEACLLVLTYLLAGGSTYLLDLKTEDI